MQTFSTQAKVGVLVLAGVVAFFAVFTYLQSRQSVGPANEYWAVFTDASGLAPKSEIRVAGVDVGAVSEIRLESGKAQVYFLVSEEIDVYPNAVVRKRSVSILGDYLLDLDPGFPQPLPPSAAHPHSQARTLYTEPLPPGSQIKNVEEAASMEALMETLTEVTRDVQRVTSNVNDLLASEKGSIHQIVQNVENLTGKLEEMVSRSSDEVAVVMANAEAISENLRRLTSGKDQIINEILANTREITRDAKSALQAFRGAMGEEGGEGLGGTLARLDRSIGHLESIAAKIDRGEGTVGKLISDERLGEQVSLAVEGASDYITRLTALRTEIALRTEYYFRAEAAKNYVRLRLIPAPDKYFLLELVDDHLGFVNRETVLRSPPGETEVAHQEIRTTSDTLKFSAQMAKRYSFFSLRFGLIESTGGFGVDLHLLNDALEVRLDAFDFSRPEASFPRVRALANLYVIPHLYVSGGIDDAFNRARSDALTNRFQLGRDYFFGGGLYFTDEDLKVLFGTLSGGLP